MCLPFLLLSYLSLSPSLPLFPPSLSQTLMRTYHVLGRVLGSWKTAGNKVLALREFTTQVVITVVSSSNSNNNNSNKYKISGDSTFPCFLFYARQQSIFLTLILPTPPWRGAVLWPGESQVLHRSTCSPFVWGPLLERSGHSGRQSCWKPLWGRQPKA